MEQRNLSIDLNGGTVVGTSLVFKHDIESAIKSATSVTLQHYSNLSAVPAFFDTVENKLYPVSDLTHYWEVQGNVLTYN